MEQLRQERQKAQEVQAPFGSLSLLRFSKINWAWPEGSWAV